VRGPAAAYTVYINIFIRASEKMKYSNISARVFSLSFTITSQPSRMGVIKRRTRTTTEWRRSKKVLTAVGRSVLYANRAVRQCNAALYFHRDGLSNPMENKKGR